MSTIPLLRVEHRWSCPDCNTTDVTYTAEPHSRMHPCKGHDGLTMPMVPAGTKAKHELREREDYTNGDLVQLHEGRPVMNVTTTRDDGIDCTVFAPTAVADLRGNR